MHVLLLLAAVSTLSAESPNLDARVPVGPKTVSVILKNVNGSAAVAYNLVVEVPAVGKKKAASRWMSWDALFDSSEAVQIAPQAERTIATNLKPRAAPITRTAVLYNDGTMAGEPDDLRRLLNVRQATVSDFPHVRMLIRSSADAGALRLELEKLRKRNGKPPSPVVKNGSSKQQKRAARDTVRLHYAGSRLPDVVLGWLGESTDKTELIRRLDRLQAELDRSPK